MPTPQAASGARSHEEPWWTSAVVYQIYVRSFADSDGDGVGDLRGVLNKVDYLSHLGVDIVWLSPIYPSPHDDGGYDISDYQDIDPLFGTLADFDELVAALHARGIKVVIDLVVNHTSDEHPWFTAARSSTSSPFRDWYWWRPARPGTTPGKPGSEPNNWRAAFSGSAWEFDESTQEYYLHLFSRRQPDLNWENPQVRQAVHQMMRWWLDRGVDGFRMDVINMISKDVLLPDGLPIPQDDFGDGSPFYLCGPRLDEFLMEMRKEVLAGRDHVLTVGEMPNVTLEQARAITDRRSPRVDMVFQFEHVQVDQGPAGKFDVRTPRPADLKASLSRWQEGLATTGWNTLYLGNHDQPRSVSRFGGPGELHVPSAKALATMLHLHRGTPFIFQGDEIGMANYPWRDVSEFRDIESLNHYRDRVERGEDPESVMRILRVMSRDNARTPMQWDSSPHAGFSTKIPWLNAHPDHTEVNVERQLEDPDSVLNYYRRLIALRHEEPAVSRGDFTLALPSHEQIYAFTRRHERTELLVVTNLSGDEADAGSLPEASTWLEARLLLANYPGEPTSWRLRPFETRVYRR
ncbi:glycoside hydrolase family 13 protein [Nonomuraea basaltis]|uniref:glycoside hydrolase family 13 protein n=1 Tax=Nonomuraea basaltis TaxID=2495887 RepID=UPI00110C4E9D|nr:alpha-glucosidase [Nonomuraea basaltis]TMR95339.1 alpha-glucosidase [Nonomuraea basaltis]